MNKVSFCIICYDKDAHLVGRILRDLKNQTSYPDEVIVVASGMTELNVEDADVKVYTFKDRMLPNKARNKAASLSSADVICLSDVDDTPHPQKIEVVRKVFEHKNVHALVHNYTMNDTNFYIVEDPVDIEKITEKEPHANSTNIMPPSKLPVHHAHITARSKVFQDVKGPEHMNFGEDGMFCRGILDSGYNFYYTEHKLISYNFGG